MNLLSRQLFVTVASAVVWASAFALEPGAHSHEPLVTTTAINYGEVLELAFDHAPEWLASDSRQSQADAYGSLGRSWLPGNPRVSLNYLDDRAGDDLGMLELEAGLEWQLWSWGAREETRQLADNYDRENRHWRQYLKLAVAGRLRTVMADLRQASLQVAQAKSAHDDAKQLRQIASKRFLAGDAPNDAVLQAQALELETHDHLLDMQAALVDAERAYQFLTGTEQRPVVDWIETQPVSAEIPENHPLIAMMRARADIAASQVEAARRDAEGSPSLSLGMRRERPSQVDDYADSVSLGISYPLGGGRLVSARVSDANRLRSDAQVEQEIVSRELRQQLHEVEHGLEVIGERLSLAAAQAAIGKQRADMARQAFAAGETTMNEVVQAWRQYQQQDSQHRLLQLQRDRLISMLNQTLGILP